MKKKVTLVYRDFNNEIAEETVWGEHVKGIYYKVKNIPFFAPNVAFNDLISVEDDNGILYFDNIIEASEHSTIQIVIFKGGEKMRIIEELENFGCTWEGMHDQVYLAVDVSPDIDYKLIKRFLKAERDKGVIDYREACLSQKAIQ